MYWCALSTPQGFGEKILAKWMSLQRHIDDKHHNHPNPLFPCCAHGDIDKRKWIKIGICSMISSYLYHSDYVSKLYSSSHPPLLVAYRYQSIAGRYVDYAFCLSGTKAYDHVAIVGSKDIVQGISRLSLD